MRILILAIFCIVLANAQDFNSKKQVYFDLVNSQFDTNNGLTLRFQNSVAKNNTTPSIGYGTGCSYNGITFCGQTFYDVCGTEAVITKDNMFNSCLFNLSRDDYTNFKTYFYLGNVRISPVIKFPNYIQIVTSAMRFDDGMISAQVTDESINYVPPYLSTNIVLTLETMVSSPRRLSVPIMTGLSNVEAAIADLGIYNCTGIVCVQRWQITITPNGYFCGLYYEIDIEFGVDCSDGSDCIRPTTTTTSFTVDTFGTFCPTITEDIEPYGTLIATINNAAFDVITMPSTVNFTAIVVSNLREIIGIDVQDFYIDYGNGDIYSYYNNGGITANGAAANLTFYNDNTFSIFINPENYPSSVLNFVVAFEYTYNNTNGVVLSQPVGEYQLVKYINIGRESVASTTSFAASTTSIAATTTARTATTRAATTRGTTTRSASDTVIPLAILIIMIAVFF